MVLTKNQVWRATRWFVSNAYRRERATAVLDVSELATAIDEIDGWLDDLPNPAQLSNLAAIRNAVSVNSRMTVEQIGMLFAATIQARVNAKTVERS